MEFFLSMVLAHVIADFILQSPRVAAGKCRGLPERTCFILAAISSPWPC